MIITSMIMVKKNKKESMQTHLALGTLFLMLSQKQINLDRLKTILFGKLIVFLLFHPLLI